jgi:cyclic pyranopterin phosphate synthase
MLVDSFSRMHDYLRVSITDRCNLRCTYCMPATGVEPLSHDEILRNEEFVRLIGVFIGLGMVKVRFTGGEPLMRRGFIGIAGRIREMFPGIELCMTTNGTLLDGFINDLRMIRVRKLNISLDSLSGCTYRAITGRDALADVITAIDEALAYDYFDVNINTVLLDTTLSELDDFLDFFKDKRVVLRFIEKMPFNTPSDDRFVSSDSLVEALGLNGVLSRNTGNDTRVAQMYDFLYRGRFQMRIGVIPPVSRKFCPSCNRLRLTSDGRLKTCLHSGDDLDLKSLIRNGADDNFLRRAIKAAVLEKRKGHALDCFSNESGCASLVESGFMSRIGG